MKRFVLALMFAAVPALAQTPPPTQPRPPGPAPRSEEHTSELQSHVNLVCRLLLEKKNTRPRLRAPYISLIFFNDTATTEIYTLSLHDALPICGRFNVCKHVKNVVIQFWGDE